MSEPLLERLAREAAENIVAGDGPGVYSVDPRYPWVAGLTRRRFGSARR